MKKFLLAFLFLGPVLNGCAGGPTPVPDPDSAAARLYVDKCGACHAVPHPKRNTAEDWHHLLPLMEQRMAERGKEPLTDEEREILSKYLDAHARQH
jgi:hypothetical protein